MDLGLIYLDSKETKYIIADNCFLIYLEFRESRQLSQDEFLRILQNRAQIGKAAEFKIIEYEKERLTAYPDLARKIEHVAIKDVSSGYDIKSFEGSFDEKGTPIPRYIEVKAVSPWDYGFAWTRNEIEKARLFQRNYYLYLLPVAGKNKFDLNGLRVIRDPYSQVYSNRKEWICTDELIGFSLVKDSKNADP